MLLSDGFIRFIGHGKLLLIGMKHLEPNDVTPFAFHVSADAFFRAAISLVAEVPRTIGKITDSEQKTIYLVRARSRNVMNEKVTMNQTNKENYR